VQSPVTTRSSDADSDSSHVTGGSCSPTDSVHDLVPRPPTRRRHRTVSRPLFPAPPPPPLPGPCDVLQQQRGICADDEHHPTSSVTAAGPPLPASWCPSTSLLVDGRSTAAAAAAASAVLPELLAAAGSSDAYCRLAAAAAAASIAGVYWGRRSDDKSTLPLQGAGVDLLMSWPSVAAAAAACNFTLPPTMTMSLPGYVAPIPPDNPPAPVPLLCGSGVLDASSWLAVSSVTTTASSSSQSTSQTDRLQAAGSRLQPSVTPDSSASSSSSSDVDLPLDLSPLAKRVLIVESLATADQCSV